MLSRRRFINLYKSKLFMLFFNKKQFLKKHFQKKVAVFEIAFKKVDCI